MIANVPWNSMPMASALLKIAELPEPPPDMGQTPHEDAPARRQGPEVKHPILHALAATAGPALAFSGGMAAGYGLQAGAEKAFGLNKLQHGPALLRYAAPALGGLSTLAYQQYKAREHKELQRALQSYENQHPGALG